jgi:hypothetical protein
VGVSLFQVLRKPGKAKTLSCHVLLQPCLLLPPTPASYSCLLPRNTNIMPAPEKAVPLSTRLGLSASAGCVASSCCHPLDVIRIQMQTGTGYKNPVDAAVHIFQRTGGIRNFYEGLSAAYLRQFTYTAFRMGTFSYLLDVVKGQSEGEVSLTTKLLVGAIAGITGSIISRKNGQRQ